MNDLLERLRQGFDNMSDREQRLTVIMGVVFAVMLTAVPLYLMSAANSELEGDNDEMRALIGRLSLERAKLQRLAQAHEGAMARYDNPTPALGSFIEGKARQQGISIREVTEEPQKTIGTYERRNVRVTMPSVGLAEVINLLDEIVTSPHPVAIEQLNFEHHKPGDSYNVKVGVLTYDKKKLSKSRAAGDDDATDEG